MIQKWLASIVVGVVTDLIGRFMAWIQAQKKQADLNKSIDEKTSGQADQLKRSETDEEDEKAVRDILNRRD